MSDSAINQHTLLAALHIGRSSGQSMSDLVAKVLGKPGSSGDEREARAVIMEMRNKGHHICGTPETGYYMAETDEELQDTCEWLYARALASLRQISAMKRVATPDLRGQLNLLARE